MKLFRQDMEYWFIENDQQVGGGIRFYWKVFGLLVINPGVSAVFWHRIARVVYLWGPAFLTPSRILDRWTEFLTGAQIPGQSDIGSGFRVYHPNGLVISPCSKLGERVCVHSDVVLGMLSGDWRVEAPIVGNDVTLGTGCKLLGDITIGDNAVVGANSVVMKSVPADHIAVGIPAKIIPQKKSEPAPADASADDVAKSDAAAKNGSGDTGAIDDAAAKPTAKANSSESSGDTVPSGDTVGKTTGKTNGSAGEPAEAASAKQS
ncbi:MAG: hypothetical protein WAP35_02410 [Solirubrobacterales bacterium]